MMPSGHPTPMGGAQSVSPSLLRSNSSITLQPTFPSPRSQYNNINLIGNMSNVSSLLNQSFGNGGSNSGLLGSVSVQRGGIDTDAESGVSFNPSSVSFSLSNTVNPNSSDLTQGPQFLNSSNHQQQQQQQYQSIRGGLGIGGPVKLEPQMVNNQNGPQQQLQPLQNLGQVKLEPQQIQTLRSLASVKLEPQYSDQLLFQQQQQQQQKQFVHMSRQSSQSAAAAAAQMNILQQQRLLLLQQQHQQHQQQQQLLKTLPQQRSQLQPQNLPVRVSPIPAYEPGMCDRRLTRYMYQQQHRPADNNIEFWRKFVADNFARNAKKRWCVSLYGSSRQTTGVFPQDTWHCEICNHKPGRGFEATVEVLPRLFKIKYDSGTLEELLYVDMPHEYQNASGQIVLDYAKAVQESVFDQLRVVRDGQLRIVFSPDLKICSWEFCARRHEELIPRKLILSQVSQVGAVAQKYQTATQNTSSNLSSQELQNNCNMFVASARQLAKVLEVPLVNELGYTKRYVRCLQISEVVNSMKDLIDYSRETGTGPMASLINFPRRASVSSGLHTQGQQSENRQKQSIAHNSNNNQSSVEATVTQLGASNGVVSVNNSLNTASTSISASSIVGLLHQNSIYSRQESLTNNGSSPYSGITVQIPSAGSSSSVPQSQPNQSSPFPSPTPSTSNNPQQTSHNALPATVTAVHMSSSSSPSNISMQQSAQPNEADPNDSQSSVQQIIQEIMMSSQLNGGGGSVVGVGSIGTDIKNLTGTVGNNNSGITGGGFGKMGGGIGPSSVTSGIRAARGTNSMSLNGRVGMPSLPQDSSMNSHHQHDMGNRLLNGLGAVNSLNNLQFDWKSSP